MRGLFVLVISYPAKPTTLSRYLQVHACFINWCRFLLTTSGVLGILRYTMQYSKTVAPIKVDPDLKAELFSRTREGQSLRGLIREMLEHCKHKFPPRRPKV